MSDAAADPLIEALHDLGAGCDLKNWPGDLAKLDLPGLYAWWADGEACAVMSARLGATVQSGIVYVGQAGASLGLAGSQATLASRLGGNHIAGKIRNSTVRLTAAAILLEEVRGLIAGDRNIGSQGERVVSAWLAAHFRVTVAPVNDRAQLDVLEAAALARIDPPLNLRSMPTTPVRAALNARRRVLRKGGRDQDRCRPTAVGLTRVARTGDRRVTLHDEIVRSCCGTATRGWIRG